MARLLLPKGFRHGNTPLVVAVVAVLAFLAVAAFIVFRRRARVTMKWPFDTGMDIDASNEQPVSPPGITIGTTDAQAGDVITEDQTRRGIEAQHLRAGQGVRTTLSQQENKSDPRV